MTLRDAIEDGHKRAHGLTPESALWDDPRWETEWKFDSSVMEQAIREYIQSLEEARVVAMQRRYSEMLDTFVSHNRALEWLRAADTPIWGQDTMSDFGYLSLPIEVQHDVEDQMVEREPVPTCKTCGGSMMHPGDTYLDGHGQRCYVSGTVPRPCPVCGTRPGDEKK